MVIYPLLGLAKASALAKVLAQRMYPFTALSRACQCVARRRALGFIAAGVLMTTGVFYLTAHPRVTTGLL